MFSLIVAWTAFVGSCVLLLIALWVVISASELDQKLARIQGEKITLINPKFFTILLVWFVSGIYLFG